MAEATTLEMPIEILSVFERTASGAVREWTDLCWKFLQWEREHVLLRHPSPEEEEQHRKALKLLIRFTKLLHVMTSDPDFPDRSLEKQLSGRLLQLQSSWDMLNNPMTADEADKLARETFTSSEDQAFLDKLASP